MSAHGPGAASEYDEAELGKIIDINLFRRLGHYLLPYKWLVVLAIFLAVLAAVLRVIGPMISRVMIDKFIPATTPEMHRGLTHYSLLYIGMMSGAFFVNFLLAYTTAWVGQKGMYDLRKEIFEKIHSLSLSFFDRTPSGRLLTRSTSDVDVLNDLFSDGIVNIFTDLILLFGILIAWFWVDWRLGFLLLFMGPLLAIASYNFRIRARTAYRKTRTCIAALNAYLQENLAGMRTVQSFNREKKSIEKFSSLNAPYRDAQYATVQQHALFFPLVEVISNFAVIVVLVYGAWLATQGLGKGEKPLTAGTFFLYFQYIGWFFMPILDLAERYNIFQAAMASSERVFQLLDHKVDVLDPVEAQPVPPLSQSVEMRNVWFAYGKEKPTGSEEWVLRDVSLKVEKGQTVALVGATGAGKSTVINLITRLYDVQRGGIYYDGLDVRAFRQDDLRRRMSIVLQDVFLFSGTIEDNIRLGNREISDEGVIQAAKYVNAHDFITRLPQRYKSEVLERGATLSTGQKQLLSFARAVAFNPDLLILDEATANIDTETEALIQNALQKLMRDKTCIIIAHRLSTIQNAAKIVVFHHGRIEEEGTHQELLRQNGLYKHLYDLQYRV